MGSLGWFCNHSCWNISRRSRKLLVRSITIRAVYSLICDHSAFRYLCSARGEKLEKTRLDYACLARIVRDGGLKVAIVARFSAIPGHCESIDTLVFGSLRALHLR